jgi:hypothetical protein
MKRPFGQRRFYLSILGAFLALLFASTCAEAQTVLGFYQLDWSGPVNNSAGSTDTEDNWVANSYTARSGGTHLASITLPIADTFTNQPISALIYYGLDYTDPQAGPGLMLLSETDTTFSSTPGTLLTIKLTNPVDLNAGDNFYAAVLIPGVPANKYPFYIDTNRQPSIGQSFFDVGLTSGAPYDINQGSANITPFGGNHPVVGTAVPAGTLALWVNATTSP